MKVHSVVIGRQDKKAVFQLPAQGRPRCGRKEPGGFPFRQGDHIFTVLKRGASSGHGAGVLRKGKFPRGAFHERHGFGNGVAELVQTAFPGAFPDACAHASSVWAARPGRARTRKASEMRMNPAPMSRAASSTPMASRAAPAHRGPSTCPTR